MRHLPSFEASPLSGKSCLLVGASGGIGAACAKALAVAGASVLLSGRDQARLDEVRTLLAAGGVEEDRMAIEAGDLLAPSTAPRLVAATRERFGGLDVVINAAGVGYFEPFQGADPERLLLQLQTNTGGAVRLAHAAVGALVQSGGHFVQIGSGLAHTTKAKTAAYSASQHGLVGLLHGLRLEYGPKVRFSLLTVAGAGVDTRFWDRADRRADRAAMMKPEGVAAALISLLEVGGSVVMDDVRLRTP